MKEVCWKEEAKSDDPYGKWKHPIEEEEEEEGEGEEEEDKKRKMKKKKDQNKI